MSDTSTAKDHPALAEAVRSRVTDTSGTTDAGLRRAAMLRAGGGEATDEPYDDLALQIGTASYRVTDKQVAAVRERLGSDKAAFEIIMAAAIGSGLMRWDRALRAIEEAGDAAV